MTAMGYFKGIPTIKKHPERNAGSFQEEYHQHDQAFNTIVAAVITERALSH